MNKHSRSKLAKLSKLKLNCLAVTINVDFFDSLMTKNIDCSLDSSIMASVAHGLSSLILPGRHTNRSYK